MPCVFLVNRHVNDGSYAVAVDVIHSNMPHQLVVAGSHGVTVNPGNDAVAAELLNVTNTAAVNFLTVGFLKALADGMAGGRLCQGGVFHQLGVLQLVVVDAVDLEYTLGQRTGFIEHHHPGL